MSIKIIHIRISGHVNLKYRMLNMGDTKGVKAYRLMSVRTQGMYWILRYANLNYWHIVMLNIGNMEGC